MKKLIPLTDLISKIFLICVIINLNIFNSFAETKESSLEIKADNSLEWHQLDKKLLAYGNAIIQNDEILIKADTISAYYSGDIQDGKILKIDADQNAIIQNKNIKIIAEKIYYDLIKNTIEVYGEKIALTTSNFNLTAKEKLLYFENEGLINTTGNVKAYYKENLSINSEEIKALINKNGELLHISAYNAVKINLNKNSQIITGDQAYLDNKKSTIELKGNVVLIQGSSKLKGDIAIVDIANGISRVLSNSNNSVNGFIVNSN